MGKEVYIPGAPIDRQKLNDDLVGAAKNGKRKLIKSLLAQGADIHFNEDLPLREAAYNGWPKTTMFLIKHGADIHACNESPLALAVVRGNPRTVEALLKAGAVPLPAIFKVANERSRRDCLEVLLNHCPKSQLDAQLCERVPWELAVKEELLRRGAKTREVDTIPLDLAQ